MESRIRERLDDCRPLYEAVMAAAPQSDLVRHYRGTELVDCQQPECPSGWIVTGPRDTPVILELCDEGWTYAQGRMYCPDHQDAAVDDPRSS